MDGRGRADRLRGVAGAATTPIRSLAIATSLFERGAPREAYAVLMHGLSLEAAEYLTTEDVVRLLPGARPRGARRGSRITTATKTWPEYSKRSPSSPRRVTVKLGHREVGPAFRVT